MENFKKKKNLLSMLIILLMGFNFLCPISAYASTKTWESVGSAGFSADEAQLTSIAIDGSGTPYVVYADGANSWKTTVMKYTGNGSSGWEVVGNADVSADQADYPSIAIDGYGNPYVVYEVYANGKKAAVMKFEK